MHHNLVLKAKRK